MPYIEWFPITETSSVLKVISEKIHEICKSRIADSSARGCLVINSIAELVSRNEKVGPALEDVFSTYIEYLESVLAIALERGEIEKCDLRIKALAIEVLDRVDLPAAKLPDQRCCGFQKQFARTGWIAQFGHAAGHLLLI